MPYPESCPECGGAFRNTGTHFTARRNELGRRPQVELVASGLALEALKGVLCQMDGENPAFCRSRFMQRAGTT